MGSRYSSLETLCGKKYVATIPGGAWSSILQHRKDQAKVATRLIPCLLRFPSYIKYIRCVLCCFCCVCPNGFPSCPRSSLAHVVLTRMLSQASQFYPLRSNHGQRVLMDHNFASSRTRRSRHGRNLPPGFPCTRSSAAERLTPPYDKPSLSLLKHMLPRRKCESVKSSGP